MAVYGMLDPDGELDESADPSTFTNVDDYGLSKTLAEDVLKHFATRRGMTCIALRLSAVHAPGEMQRRGTHVDDVAQAFRLALRSGIRGFQVINLVPGNPGWRLSNAKARAILGWDPQHSFAKRPDLENWNQPNEPPPEATGSAVDAVAPR